MPPTQLKVEIGQRFADHPAQMKALMQELKNQGYQHGQSTLYRWRKYAADQRRPRKSGGQSKVDSPRQEHLRANLGAAVNSRSAKAVRAFKKLLVLAMIATRHARGESTLGVNQLLRRTSNVYARKMIKRVKPQVTTLVRWIACNCIRNAIVLYCVMKACMWDPVLRKWILPANSWNADNSTIAFGFAKQKASIQAAIPIDCKVRREIEVVADRRSTLPYSIKLASLQGGHGGAGPLLFLFKTQVKWFSKHIQVVHASLQPESKMKSGVVNRARKSVLKLMNKVKARYLAFVRPGVLRAISIQICPCRSYLSKNN